MKGPATGAEQDPARQDEKQQQADADRRRLQVMLQTQIGLAAKYRETEADVQRKNTAYDLSAAVEAEAKQRLDEFNNIAFAEAESARAVSVVDAPRWRGFMGFSLTLSFVIGCAIAWLRGFASATFFSVAQVRRELPAPVVGVIASASPWRLTWRQVARRFLSGWKTSCEVALAMVLLLIALLAFSDGGFRAEFGANPLVTLPRAGTRPDVLWRVDRPRWRPQSPPTALRPKQHEPLRRLPRFSPDPPMFPRFPASAEGVRAFLASTCAYGNAVVRPGAVRRLGTSRPTVADLSQFGKHRNTLGFVTPRPTRAMWPCG